MKRTLSIFKILSFGLLSALALGMTGGASAQVYVSPSGSDANAGSLTSPVQTLSQAQALAQQKSGAARQVILRGGTYRLPSTLALTAADSGEAWKAYPGEVPIVSGGRMISGWTLADSGKNIWQANTLGLTFRQLWVGGVRCQRVRSTAVASGTAVTGAGYTWGDSSLSSLARPQDLEMVQDNQWTEARCPVLSVSGTTVTMQSPAWTYCETKAGVSLGVPTWIENAYEFLSDSTPGQFYLNSASSSLYYVPRPGENMAAATVIAPLLQTIVSVSGTLTAPAKDITFSGIAFEYAGYMPTSGFAEIQANVCKNAPGDSSAYNGYAPLPAAVSIAYCQRINFTRCVFAHDGGAGLLMGYGCQQSAVRGCLVTDTGGNGIEIGDPTVPLHRDVRQVVLGNTVADNWVHDACVEFRGGVGLIAWYASGLTVTHNQVNALPYTGISCGWGWGNTAPSDNQSVTISRNLIFSVNHALNDGAGIYLNSVQPGLLVWGNVIHDIPALNGTAGGATAGGLYTDNGSRYDVLQGNVVYNTPGFNIHTNDNRGDTLIQYNTLDAGNHYDGFVSLASGAGPNVYIRNFTAPPTADPATVASAGLEPGYRDILSLTP